MKDNSDPPALADLQLLNELQRTKINEKRLMDQNKELKKKLTIIEFENSRLKKKEQALNSDKLTKEREKARTERRNEAIERAHEKNTLEQRILALQKQSLEMKSKYSLEKMLREQREKELDKLNPLKSEKLKLTTHVQVLKSEVEGLKGYKNFASKKMEEQSQLLKSKDKDHNVTKEELKKTRESHNYYKSQVEMLIPFRVRLECVQKDNEKKDNLIKKMEKQADVHRKRIHRQDMEIGFLTRKIEDNITLNATMGYEKDQMHLNMNSLTAELEKHKKENEKARNIIQNLESELNSNSEMRSKFENRMKERIRESRAKDQEIIALRVYISESEGRERKQIILTEASKAEKNLISQNLFKAQTVLDEVKIKIQQHENDLRLKSFEIDTLKSEQVKLKRHLRSKKSQHEKMKLKLAQTQRTQEICSTSAGKNQTVFQYKMAEKEAEIEKLDKDLMLKNNLIVKQRDRINLLKAAKVTEEEANRECVEVIKALEQENETLKRNLYFTNLKMMRETADLEAMLGRDNNRAKTRNLNMMYNPHCEPQFSERKGLLEEKEKEIRELKRMLAQRPDEAIKKLQRCQWDNRDLKKKFMASHGFATMYETNYKSVKEENERLIHELRELKLESQYTSRYTLLPPISKRSQSPPGDKSNDLCDSGHISRHTGFPLRSTKSQRKSENKPEIPLIPPMSTKVQCRGEQIRTHPPP